MTEEPFDSNMEVEPTEPEEPSPVEITPPPLPDTGYETQVLEPESEDLAVESEPAVVMTTPPVIPAVSEEELEVPSPFDQEQPEPITVGATIEPGASDLPPASPPSAGEPPKKNNTTLIIIIVVAALILLCCCCALILLGATFWEDIAWELGLNLVQRLM